MKALILAGGTGSRLRPLTYTSAKQLIPIANKPILFYAVEAIQEAGITEIGVIVGDTADEVRAALGDGSIFGVNFTFIPQDAPLGLAHAVLTAADFLGDSPFLMFLGDNLIAAGVKDLADQFREDQPDAMVLLSRVPEPQRFGVVELKEGRVVCLVEKPEVPPSDLALVGVYLFQTRILEACRSIAPSGRGELEITDAIQWLVDQGLRVEPSIVDGWWKDTGKPEDVLAANHLVLDAIESAIEGEVCPDSDVSGRVVLESGATVLRSTIRGPVIIGSGATIEDAYIGPYTAISRDVTVSHSEVENSILLDGSGIHNVQGRIDSSLLGKNAQIEAAQGKPQVTRLVMGDNSRVWTRS
ncbi:MAG: glucose-1-phosphate thymidylyltransferase [Myxococcota bacterium]|nr:glucose-1-phosphate thymidylyltransferase [Myxococcota bacterium]